MECSLVPSPVKKNHCRHVPEFKDLETFRSFFYVFCACTEAVKLHKYFSRNISGGRDWNGINDVELTDFKGYNEFWFTILFWGYQSILLFKEKIYVFIFCSSICDI